MQPLRPFVPSAAQIPDPKSLTVQGAIDLWIAHDVKRTGRCSDSAKERERLLREFCETFGSRLVSECCAGDLQFWLDAHERWKSDWTILRALRTVNRPFNWLHGLGVVTNPFKGLTHPPGERGRPMSPQEFQKFLRKTDAIFRRVLIFLRYTGVRPGELRELEWTHIQFEADQAVLVRHKTVRSRKDRAPRVVVLHPVVIKLLIWLRRRNHEKHIFLNSKGLPWTKTALCLRIYRMREKLGIDKSCKLYGTRHEWATQLAIAGTDIASLAELLGHTSWEMARHYVHAHGRKDHLRAAVLKAFPAKHAGPP
jgi:integrase